MNINDTWLKGIVVIIMVVCVGFSLACATVTFLPTDDSTTYTPTETLKVYWKEPQQPYIVIGKILAKQGGRNVEEQLFKTLKQKAMRIGAHAIIMRGTSQKSSGAVLVPVGTSFFLLPATEVRIEAFAIRFTN